MKKQVKTVKDATLTPHGNRKLAAPAPFGAMGDATLTPHGNRKRRYQGASCVTLVDATLTPHGNRKLLGLCAGSVGFVLMQLLPLTGDRKPLHSRRFKEPNKMQLLPLTGTENRLTRVRRPQNPMQLLPLTGTEKKDW